MILPGELFGWYRWGETGDSVAPYLTPRRLTIRELARFADLRSSQLLTTIDNLVQQDRLVPGQLTPLLQMLGVGAVLVPTDGNIVGDGSVDPADAAHALRDQPGFRHPAQTYGSRRTYTPLPGRDGPQVSLPDMRRYALPRTSPGVVRVQPFAATTILDGDGTGITELAADGMLDPGHAIVYAGDLHGPTTHRLLSTGARLVFTDSNRRQILAASSLSANTGPTLGVGDPISVETPSYDLFPAHGSAAQTVSEFSGLSELRTPALHNATAFFPASSASAAFDGRLDTAWLADAQAPLTDRYIDIRLGSPLPVRTIRIYPLAESLGITTQVGITVNGGPERLVSLTPGWNTIAIDTPALRELRVRVTGVLGLGSAGGISEIRIPGLTVRQALRLPTDLAQATAGRDLRHDAIVVLLARTTADFPYHEQTAAGDLQALSVVHAPDAESGIRRVVTLPVARSFRVGGWASVRAAASDPLLDHLARLPAGWRFSSSDRFEGVPINRASSAFDGDASTAWVAHYVEGRTSPWIEWASPRPLTIRRMLLTPGAAQYEFPNRVRITAPGTAPRTSSSRPMARSSCSGRFAPSSCASRCSACAPRSARSSSTASSTLSRSPRSARPA